MMRLLFQSLFGGAIVVLASATPVVATHHHHHPSKTSSSNHNQAAHNQHSTKNREDHHNHEWSSTLMEELLDQTLSSTSTISQKFGTTRPRYGERQLEQDESEPQQHRQAEDAEAPECGAEIGRVTTEEIQQLMTLYLASLFEQDGDTTINPALMQSATSALLSVIQYDLVAVKVCLSCNELWFMKDVFDLTSDELSNTDQHGFSTYCAPWSYGYEAIHSALVFAPIDPETNDIFDDAVLRVALAGRSDRVTVQEAPSASWPSSVSDVISSLSNTNNNSQEEAAKIQTFFRSHIASLMSATAGAIAIMPDFLGFGASQDFDRTFLTPLPYQQAFVVSYYATQDYFYKRNIVASAMPGDFDIQEDGTVSLSGGSSSSAAAVTARTNSNDGAITSVTVQSNGACTLVDKVVSLSGYSEGGYAALVGALALEQVGIRVLSTHIGGAPLHLDRQVGFSLGRFTREQSIDEELFIAYMAYSYSSGLPVLGLANSGTGQNFVNPDWADMNDKTRDVPSWFTVDETTKTSVEILELLQGVNLTDVVHPDIVGLYERARQDGVLGACTNMGARTYVTNTTDKVCQALIDSVLWDELSEQVNFPTVICHSPDDQVVGMINVPPVLENPFVSLYDPSLPVLAPRGSHAQAEITCALDPVTVIAFGREDTPVEMQTITELLTQDDPSRMVPSYCKRIIVEDIATDPPVPSPTPPAPTIVNEAPIPVPSSPYIGTGEPTIAPAYGPSYVFDSGASPSVLAWSTIPSLAAVTILMGNILFWFSTV